MFHTNEEKGEGFLISQVEQQSVEAVYGMLKVKQEAN